MSSRENMLRILCIIDYYLPGFKAGGPIRTMENMVSRLSGDLDFNIYTRDRDLGASGAFDSVEVNAWNVYGRAKVYYASPIKFRFQWLFRFVKFGDFDVLYLNSFFSCWAAIVPLLSSRLFRVGKPTIIAPRGEFSKGALGIKRRKKAIYISLAKFLGLYKGVHWHASSQAEADDILKIFPDVGADISIAAGLVASETSSNSSRIERKNGGGVLRIVFISRIVAMKNLGYLLYALHGVSSEISLTIFGPIEEESYWQECCEKIQSLPANICAEYVGALPAEEVQEKFSQYDLFVLPTLGENFGHVIFESIRAGTPVLISDRTPWCNESNGVINTLPLDDVTAWSRMLDMIAQQDATVRRNIREAAILFAREYLANDSARKANLAMFARAALAVRQ